MRVSEHEYEPESCCRGGVSAKGCSSSCVSDKSDEFFSNGFVKKYLNIPNRIGIVLSVLSLVVWVAYFFIFCFGNANNWHLLQMQEVFRMFLSRCRTKNSLTILNYLCDFFVTFFLDSIYRRYRRFFWRLVIVRNLLNIAILSVATVSTVFFWNFYRCRC